MRERRRLPWALAPLGPAVLLLAFALVAQGCSAGAIG